MKCKRAPLLKQAEVLFLYCAGLKGKKIQGIQVLCRKMYVYAAHVVLLVSKTAQNHIAQAFYH